MKITNETLSQRLNELGWNIYRLGQIFKRMRNEPHAQVSRYHSAISKVIENPSASKLATVADVIETLGGRLTIEWEDAEAYKQAMDALATEEKLAQRIALLESELQTLKQGLDVLHTNKMEE